MDIGANIIVEGLVQGVGFRYFVYNRAVKLNLRGYVKNLLNGNVEIDVEGERSAIETLIAEVKVGPRFAMVKNVIVKWKNVEQFYKGFQIL
ncbi:MAG: Acylphosphate phosphohydrolase [Ignavibacteriae bacterium]|nr:MAG: Acylphosphate phosphohydrolase [Ignavibacteriota bacterium]